MGAAARRFVLGKFSMDASARAFDGFYPRLIRDCPLMAPRARPVGTGV